MIVVVKMITVRVRITAIKALKIRARVTRISVARGAMMPGLATRTATEVRMGDGAGQRRI